MSPRRRNDVEIPRRRFLKLSAAGVGAVGATGAGTQAGGRAQNGARRMMSASPDVKEKYSGNYTGERLSRIAFPMGGMGAGMICLEGTRTLSHFSLRNRPEVFNEPCVFAAVGIRGKPEAARLPPAMVLWV